MPGPVSENLLKEIGKIDSPVTPYMSPVRLVVLIWISVTVKITAETDILFIQEIILSYGDVVKFHPVGKLPGNLPVEIRIHPGPSSS